VHLFASDLLALRTAAEWEEVTQRISDLPQDDALTAEFSKVLPSPAAQTHAAPLGADWMVLREAKSRGWTLSF